MSGIGGEILIHHQWQHEGYYLWIFSFYSRDVMVLVFHTEKGHCRYNSIWEVWFVNRNPHKVYALFNIVMVNFD